jgi:hypothetical protein
VRRRFNRHLAKSASALYARHDVRLPHGEVGDTFDQRHEARLAHADFYVFCKSLRLWWADPAQVDEDACALVEGDKECVLVGIPNKLATVRFSKRRIQLIDQPEHTSAVARLLNADAQKRRKMILYESKRDLRPVAHNPQLLCCRNGCHVAPCVPAVLSRLRFVLPLVTVARYRLVLLTLRFGPHPQQVCPGLRQSVELGGFTLVGKAGIHRLVEIK